MEGHIMTRKDFFGFLTGAVVALVESKCGFYAGEISDIRYSDNALSPNWYKVLRFDADTAILKPIWHHVVWVSTGTGTKLYIDGKIQS
jgi:hypothetical protein